MDAGLLMRPAETALHQAIEIQQNLPMQTLADYSAYLDGLGHIARAPVDAFFEAVMVNDEDDAIRQNRLSLLQSLDWANATRIAFDLIE